MPKQKDSKQIEQYTHKNKDRLNNPPAGLVKPHLEQEGRKLYQFDPHIDPELAFDPSRNKIDTMVRGILENGKVSIQEILNLLEEVEEKQTGKNAKETVSREELLNIIESIKEKLTDSTEELARLNKMQDAILLWAGKPQRTSFEVPTVSLHVHERIDPRTILQAVRNQKAPSEQPSLFASAQENPPLQEAIEFYKHKHNWSNRLVAGDSLLVMNSLLEKEGMAGKVQTIYFDPPYGIKYGSNFQPFINKRDVKDGSDEDLTAEPEMLKAFRDTWELGIHSYLSYIRDRLLLSRELLTESGSIFVQISDENVHRVRMILDEVFGSENFVSEITFRKKTMPLGAKYLEEICDYIIFYAKNKNKLKYNQLYESMDVQGDSHWNFYEDSNGKFVKLNSEQINNHSLLPSGSQLFQLVSMSPIGFDPKRVFEIPVGGKKYFPPKGKSWKTDPAGAEKLKLANRLLPYQDGNTLRYILKLNDYSISPITALWASTSAPSDMNYVVQTNQKVIQRCILMTTEPGDLVFDPTCGSGTTAFVAEQWGRRWITCDTSRVAVTLAKQRLMTGIYDYYELANPKEGVSGNFKYKTVPHITLKSIANNPDIREGMSREQIEKSIAKYADQETLVDQPFADTKKARVTGPFTVEAVPALTVKSLDEIRIENQRIVEGQKVDVLLDDSISREDPTLRHNNWISELMKSGIRAKNGVKTSFAYVNTMPALRWIHADAKTVNGERVVLSFGPEHAPIGKVQVNRAMEEAEELIPKPKIVVFASFHFDPEASKTIDSLKWEGVTIVKVQMNADLITEDLKKKQTSSESFWYIGQPDISLRKISHGKDTGKFYVEVHGFDYYDPKTGKIIQGDSKKIAMWMIDTDYDGRSIFPRQVFFPMSGDKDGWTRLAKNLKAEIDEGLIEHYSGTVSLPFEVGEHRRVAIKIVDDRGIETIKVVEG